MWEDPGAGGAAGEEGEAVLGLHRLNSAGVCRLPQHGGEIGFIDNICGILLRLAVF